MVNMLRPSRSGNTQSVQLYMTVVLTDWYLNRIHSIHT